MDVINSLVLWYSLVPGSFICSCPTDFYMYLLSCSVFPMLHWGFTVQFSSVAQSCPTLCNPMDCSTPGFPVHLPTPGTCSNSCLSSWWYHPIFTSYVVPFSSYPQSFPASGSFQVSQFFTSGGQIIGVSASPSVLSMNIQDWFPLEWTGWISLLSKGLSRFSPTPQFKSISSSVLSFLYGPTLTSVHDYWKNYSFD